MIARFITLLIPALVLPGGAALLLDTVAQLPESSRITLSQLPYVLTGVVALLAYGFNCSQILFAALNLIGAYALIQTGLQTSLDQPAAYVLFSILSLLMPLHFTLISTYSERGLLTRIGILRLTGVVVSYLLLGYFWFSNALAPLLTALPLNLLEMFFEGRFLSQMAAVFYGVAIITNLIYLLSNRGHGEGGILAGVVSSLCVLIWFDQPNISTLMVSAALIAMAISVVQSSHNMAYLDELTGIPGRRALQDKLATLGKRYTLAMVDIDHFKKFNDTYGHDTGDQVLRMVAAKLATVRGGGKAYRYGGEEFTLVFPGKEEEQALPHIEELRELIANYPLRVRGNDRPDDSKAGASMRGTCKENDSVAITISIGLSHKTDELPDTAAVIKAADTALYEAKHQGRNRSVAAHYAPQAGRRRSRRDYA